MKKILIIGKPGSGKTTLLEKLKDKNYLTEKCDNIVKFLYSKDQQGFNLLKELNANFVSENKVNKEQIWKFLNENPENIQVINQLIHPLINQELEKSDKIIFECPLTNSSYFDAKDFLIIELDVKKEIAIQRLVDFRGLNLEKAKKLVDLFTVENNLIKPDLIIDANQGIDDAVVNKVIDFINEKSK